MPTVDCLTAWFSEVDDPRRALPTQLEARLWPRAGGTWGLLHARTGVGHRAFYRWLPRASRALWPQLPARPRLLRLGQTPQDWTQVFLAAPTVLGVIDASGSARIDPRREGRSPPPRGRTGVSHQRWMVGGPWGLRRQQWGWIGAGAGATAHGAETAWQGRMRPCEERMLGLSARGCQAAEGAPTPLTLCPRGAWPDRRLVATGRSRLTLIRHGKQGMPRVWASCPARLAFPLAALPVLVPGHGCQPSTSGFVPLSMAELSL